MDNGTVDILVENCGSVTAIIPVSETAGNGFMLTLAPNRGNGWDWRSWLSHGWQTQSSKVH